MPGDTHGGAGYDFQVIPPIGHILRGGEKRYDQIIITTGDLHPSDLDDVFPTVVCEVSEYLDFDQKEPLIEAKELAQSAGRQQNNQATSGGGASSKREKKKPEKDGCGSSVGCNYEVYVTWMTTKWQGSGGCGGPCGPNVTGCPSCIEQYMWKVCHSYQGANFAMAAYRSWLAQKKSISDTWYPNETAVIGVQATMGSYKKPSMLNDDDAAEQEQACEDDYERAKQQSGAGGGGGGAADDGSFMDDQSQTPVSDHPDLPGSPTDFDGTNPYYDMGDPIAGDSSTPGVDDAGNALREEGDPTSSS